MAKEGGRERLSMCAQVRMPPGSQGEEVESLGSPGGGGSGSGNGVGSRCRGQCCCADQGTAVQTRSTGGNLLAGRQGGRRPGVMVPPGAAEVQGQVLMDFPRSAAGL